MNESDIYDEYERLWNSYDACCQSAESLRPMRPHDDEFVRMAIVGFSFHEKIERLRDSHLRFVRDYHDECDQLGDSTKARKFSLLALGALLGMHCQQVLTTVSIVSDTSSYRDL